MSASATTSRAAELADLVERLTARIQAREAIDFDAVRLEHPEHAEELERLIPALALLADFSRSPGAALTAGDGESESGTLGDFRLIREVGRGGMGIVYEAEQISLNRNVALKVLPFAATMDPRHLQRFRNEAQAAACLHHPNIVPVHGVGSDRGVHYYAMQLIEGQTLAEVISASRERERPESLGRASQRERDVEDPHVALTPRRSPSTAPNAILSTKRDRAHFRTIATLIASAADALEYAHSMGVVHRDIKPGNLMLDFSPLPASGRGAGGEDAHLWITDFGLAKLANPAREGGGELTMTGDLLGTLRYMSPEQALARHGLVDHRTDIYSLGATLYELLTLKPAVAGADKAEILKAIAWDEPTPLRKHDKSIPAELETITLKCLAKEPGERYATAGEVAEDLQRWLGDHAIKAKPPGWREKAAKWGRRHRGLVTSATALVLLTVVGLAISGWYIWREKENARLAKDAADEQAALAKQFETFMMDDLFGQVRAYREGGPPTTKITLTDALSRVSERIDERFSDRPRIAAALHRAVGMNLLGAGNATSAISNLDRSAQILSDHLGPDDVYTLSVLHDLAFAFKEAGRTQDAIRLGESVRAKRAEILGTSHIDSINTTHNLSRVYILINRYDKAIQLLEQNCDLLERMSDLDDPHLRTNRNSLALAYSNSGRHKDAIRILERLRERQEHSSTSAGKVDLRILNDLGLAYLNSGEHAKAIPVLEQTLQSITQQSGDDHPNALRAALNLGQAYQSANRPADALKAFQLIRDHGRSTLGVEHSVMLSAACYISELLLQKKSWTEAEKLLRETVELVEKKRPDQWQTFSMKSMLGGALLGQQKFAEAEPFLLQGYQGLKDRKVKMPPPARMHLMESLKRLVEYYDATNQPEKSAEWRKTLDDLSTAKSADKNSD